MHNLGNTRSANRRDHLLHTPGHLRPHAVCLASRAARQSCMSRPPPAQAFTQYTAELEPAGTLGPTPAQRFVYVLSGAAPTSPPTPASTRSRPAATPTSPRAWRTPSPHKVATRLAVIEKLYQPLAGVAAPTFSSAAKPKLPPPR